MVKFMALAVGLLGVCTESRLPAFSTAQPRLHGLKKIAVTISTDPDCDLDRHSIKATVESKLRAAGIRVDNGSRSNLNIAIGVSMIRSGAGADLGFAYSIHVGLLQQVYLAHNPNRLTEAVTWERMSLGTSSAKELGVRCARTISREMDEFVSIYLASSEK
jgi:hypothetical protein